MRQAQPAKILRIHIGESDRFRGKPLYEALVARCRELGMAGVTVFRGLEGYGETAELHRAHLAWSGAPVVAIVVDSPENVERLMRAAAEMIGTGLMAVSDAESVRVVK